MVESMFSRIKSVFKNIKKGSGPEELAKGEPKFFVDYLNSRRLPSSTEILAQNQAPLSLRKALEQESAKIVPKLASDEQNIVVVVVYGPPRSGTSTFATLLKDELRQKYREIIGAPQPNVSEDESDSKIIEFRDEQDSERQSLVKVIEDMLNEYSKSGSKPKVVILVSRLPENILQLILQLQESKITGADINLVKTYGIWDEVEVVTDYFAGYLNTKGLTEKDIADFRNQIQNLVELCAGHYYLIQKIIHTLYYGQNKAEEFFPKFADPANTFSLPQLIADFHSEFYFAFGQIKNVVPENILRDYFENKLPDNSLYREFLDSIIPPKFRTDTDFRNFLLGLYSNNI